MTDQQDQLGEEGEDDKFLQRRRLDLQQDTGGEDSDNVDIHSSNSSPIFSPPAYIYATSISSSSSQDEMEVCRRQSAAAIRRYYSQNSKIQQEQYRSTSDDLDDNQDCDASEAPPHISFDYGSDDEEEEEEEDLNSIWCQSNQIKKESD